MSAALPPRGHPDAPKYWMDETGGRLGPAIRNYLDGREMSADDIALVRDYLRQWIDSPAWDMNPHMNVTGIAALAWLRSHAKAIATRSDIAYWLMRAEERGIEPL